MVAEEKTNPHLRALIRELRSPHDGKRAPAWRAVAIRLERPRHQLRPVNLGHLERVASAGELVVVPTKLLAKGDLKKALHIAALGWSDEAGRKVIAAGGQLSSLQEAFQSNPQGKGVHIIG